MGVAVVVLNILGTVPLQTNVTLLGIGLAALAVAEPARAKSKHRHHSWVKWSLM